MVQPQQHMVAIKTSKSRINTWMCAYIFPIVVKTNSSKNVNTNSFCLQLNVQIQINYICHYYYYYSIDIIEAVH